MTTPFPPRKGSARRLGLSKPEVYEPSFVYPGVEADLNEDAGFGPLMRFVAVESEGGVFDDDAFCAGWEMGELAARLRYEQPEYVEIAYHTDNELQLDLIAMAYGYVVEGYEMGEGWSWSTVAREGVGVDAPGVVEGEED